MTDVTLKCKISAIIIYAFKRRAGLKLARAATDVRAAVDVLGVWFTDAWICSLGRMAR